MKEKETLDPYYIGYHMMIESLEHNNIFNGLSKSLYFAKLYLQCDDIILYKLKDEKICEKYNNNNPSLNDGYVKIGELLNKRKNKLFKQDSLEINLDDGNIKKLTFIPIMFKDLKYMIVIINSKIDSKDNFIHILKESFKVILDKMESYQQIIKMTCQDGLTSLENRLSYNIKIEEYDRVKQHVTFVMIDLFRLKYINDNFGHLKGDLYIKEVANILKKYFPSSRLVDNSFNLTSKIETGENVYRIGGDEFVVLSKNKNMEQMEQIFKLISFEASNLNLGIDQDVPIGINYGICERYHDESMEELYRHADERLSIDKKEMYNTLKINRRK